MAQLHTLRVTCRPTSVAEDKDVLGLGYGARAVWIILADSHDLLKSSQCNALGLGPCFQFFINVFHANEDESIDRGSLTFGHHVEDLVGIVGRAEDRRHLRLIEDVVDLVMAHSVVEAHRSCIVVHGRQKDLHPLSAVLRHHTDEAPFLTFTVNLWGQLE